MLYSILMATWLVVCAKGSFMIAYRVTTATDDWRNEEMRNRYDWIITSNIVFVAVAFFGSPVYQPDWIVWTLLGSTGVFVLGSCTAMLFRHRENRSCKPAGLAMFIANIIRFGLVLTVLPKPFV